MNKLAVKLIKKYQELTQNKRNVAATTPAVPIMALECFQKLAF